MELTTGNQIEKSKHKKETKVEQHLDLNSKNDLDQIVFYADGNEVNNIDYKDLDDYLNINEKEIKRQSMKGFDEEYNNIVDYIVKITHRIWNEKDIGLIYDTYSYGASVHKGLINSHGVYEVISGTLQTLSTFPDRKIGWGVIWSGNDQDGFFTSHRGKSVSTNIGDSLYGPATGRKAMFRTVADCVIHANKIYEEWLVLDTYHLVQQLGYDPVEVAQLLARKTKKMSPVIQTGYSETAELGLPPQLYIPKHNGFEIGDFILEMFNKVWERRSINHVKDFYTGNAVIHYVCNRDIVGISQIQGTLINLFASVPNAKIILDRVTCNKRDSDRDWDVAVRWRIQGMHEGSGYFGMPSGKAIEIMGINHYKVRNEKIVEEWFLFDGIEVLRQIHLETDQVDDQDDKSVEDGNYIGIS